MTVDDARTDYLYFASLSTYHPIGCAWCSHQSRDEVENYWALQADAASISLDLAYAEAARDITRRTVAW